MIDSVTTTVKQVSLEQLRALVRQGLDDGKLAITAPATRIRAYLRERGLRCTPVQSRQLREELRRSLDGHADTFGRRLAAARVARGLTQGELARIADCSESYLSYLEADARSPSERLLTALADAVRREPDWLRTGEESETTRQIERSLGLAWEALQAAEWTLVESHVARVLDQEHDRPLHVDERENALLLRGRSLCATGRDAEAVALLTPLVERVLAGLSDVPPVALGQGYVRALLNAAGEETHVLAQAWIIGQQLLNAAGDQQEDDWWRLAATLMAVHDQVSSMELSAIQGEWWLAQLRRLGEETYPSGAAALYWNLALRDLDLDRQDEALAKINKAIGLQDSTRYPMDCARLQVAYAHVLLTARPDQAQSAAKALDDCLASLLKLGYPSDRYDWILTRARADLLLDDTAGTRTRLAPLLSDDEAEPQARIGGWLLAGDSYAEESALDQALAAYRRAQGLLERMPATPVWARAWRDVGDRWTRLGDSRASSAAYRRALDLCHVTSTLP